MPLVTEDQVRTALKKVKDPEVPINLIDLGLIYTVTIDGTKVDIDMTLTAMGCPAAPQIVAEVKQAVQELPGVDETAVNLVWSPPWHPDMMSDRAKRALGRM